MSNRKRRRQTSPTARPPPRAAGPPATRGVAQPLPFDPMVAGPTVADPTVAGLTAMSAPARPEPATVAATVLSVVEDGVLDPYLHRLGAAIRRRERQLVRKPEVDAAARFEVGDPVRLGPEVRPKYLRGASATVAGWAHKNVLVRLDHAIGRYPADTEISVSPLGLRRDIS